MSPMAETLNGLLSVSNRKRAMAGISSNIPHMPQMSGSCPEKTRPCTVSTVVGRNADQVNNQVTVQDKTPAERLLLALGNDTLSAADLMVRLGLSHKQTFRKNYLNPALEQKLIERTIPDKPNSKNQKYRKHKS